jgi:hypothetical protein
MTRAERLAQAAQTAQAKLDEERKRLARIQGAQRAEHKKLRDKRRYQVGTLGDEAGLLAWDDTTLAGLFALLATLREAPNPVAMLEGLLCDVGGSPGMSVEGRADARIVGMGNP